MQDIVDFGVVLGKDECLRLRELILEAERVTKYRNVPEIYSEYLRDTDLANKMWERMKDKIPEKEILDNEEIKEWHPFKLLRKFSVVHYYENGHNSIHRDPFFKEELNRKEIKTLLFYLNDDFEGGITQFYDENQNPTIQIEPMEGKAILFDHDSWHNGTNIISGEKFAITFNVYYKPYAEFVRECTAKRVEIERQKRLKEKRKHRKTTKV